VHGDLSQPGTEPLHPPGGVPGAHLRRAPGQLHLIQQGPGDPARVRGRRGGQVRTAPRCQVSGEIGSEGVKPGITAIQGGPRRHRIDPAGVTRLSEYPAGELRRLRQPCIVKMIRLVQHRECPHRQAAHLAEQLAFAGRHRRVGGQHEHRGIHRLQRLVRRVSTPGEHRPGTGRVHQLDPAGQHRGVHERGHHRDAPPVARVTALGHQVIQRRQRMLLLVPITKTHLGMRLLAVPDGRRHRGQRRHPRRQHRTAEQRIDQRALAPLGLTRHQHPQPRRRQPVPQRRQLLPVPVGAQRGQVFQCFVQGILAVQHPRHPPTRVTRYAWQGPLAAAAPHLCRPRQAGRRERGEPLRRAPSA